MLSENVENRLEQYTASLLVTLVIYFGTGLRNLIGRKPPESSKVYYCQH